MADRQSTAQTMLSKETKFDIKLLKKIVVRTG